MKKLVGFLAIALLLCIPLAANAAPLGSGDLDVFHSAPTGGGYYLDYDGQVLTSNFGYTLGLSEVFCVSGENGNEGSYDFYAINNLLPNYATLSQAAWIADNWTTWGTSDDVKGEAQKAVWKIMGVMDITEGAGTDYNIYLAANGTSNYLTTRWYYAYSPSGGQGTDYQDFLTPVPEPTTMLLLGLGLVGLAGLRRKFKK